MNEVHLRLCASPEWAAFVKHELLPWALGDLELGDDVLEVGAGPGMTTDVLRRRVAHLTAVEVDDVLAASLGDRLAGTNVEVVHADGTSLPFPADRFDAATCFTMLHHVPSAQAQDQLLAEVRRVLRPGGLLVGTDSTASSGLAELHEGDTYVPIDPTTLAARLNSAGFSDVVVEEADGRLRFVGRANSAG
jgi:ubiquinone/menaquinone biosynthesis C-methylase UbiE